MNQQTTTLRTNKSGFEITDCSRCGGCGQYSFNLMHGSRCYGCSGAGVVLTKRGQAARKQFFASTEVPASEVKVGWMMWDESKWYAVQAIEPYGDNQTAIVTKRCRFVYSPDTTVQACESMEVVREKLAAAVASQEPTEGLRIGNPNAAHLYEVEAELNGKRANVKVDAMSRTQTGSLIKKRGWTVCSVNMIG